MPRVPVSAAPRGQAQSHLLGTGCHHPACRKPGPCVPASPALPPSVPGGSMTLCNRVEPPSSQAMVVFLLHLFGNRPAPCRPSPVSVSETTRASAAGDTFTRRPANIITHGPLDPPSPLPSSHDPGLPLSPGSHPWWPHSPVAPCPHGPVAGCTPPHGAHSSNLVAGGPLPKALSLLTPQPAAGTAPPAPCQLLQLLAGFTAQGIGPVGWRLDRSGLPTLECSAAACNRSRGHS